jgi:hypothetical protein
LVAAAVRRRETAVNRLEPHDPRLNWRGFGANPGESVEGCTGRATNTERQPQRPAFRDLRDSRWVGADLLSGACGAHDAGESRCQSEVPARSQSQRGTRQRATARRCCCLSQASVSSVAAETLGCLAKQQPRRRRRTCSNLPVCPGPARELMSCRPRVQGRAKTPGVLEGWSGDH